MPKTLRRSWGAQSEKRKKCHWLGAVILHGHPNKIYSCLLSRRSKRKKAKQDKSAYETSSTRREANSQQCAHQANLVIHGAFNQQDWQLATIRPSSDSSAAAIFLS
jgi:hypothetical protein